MRKQEGCRWTERSWRKASYELEGRNERAEAVWKRYTSLVERYKAEIAMGLLTLANRVVVRIRSEVSSGTYESGQPVRCLVETDLGDAYATRQLSSVEFAAAYR